MTRVRWIRRDRTGQPVVRALTTRNHRTPWNRSSRAESASFVQAPGEPSGAGFLSQRLPGSRTSIAPADRAGRRAVLPVDRRRPVHGLLGRQCGGDAAAHGRSTPAPGTCLDGRTGGARRRVPLSGRPAGRTAPRHAPGRREPGPRAPRLRRSGRRGRLPLGPNAPRSRRGGIPARVPPLLAGAPEPPAGSVRVGVNPTAAPGVCQRLSLPSDWAAARPASSLATGMRNGEHET